MDAGHVKRQLQEAVGTADPYAILNVSREATSEEVKRAYRLQALKHHPDKGGDPNKFRAVSIAHSILSDVEKRAVFDQTGDVDESGEEIDEASFEQWYEYYRQLFPPITANMIDSFAEKYKGSEEEQTDVLAAYAKHGGDVGKIMDSVMLAESVQDYGRFEAIINAAIARGEVALTNKWKARKPPKVRAEPVGQDLMDDGEDGDGDEEGEGESDDDDEEKEQRQSPKKRRGANSNGSGNPGKGKGKSKAGGAPTKAAKAKANPAKKGSGAAPSQSLEELILSRKGGARNPFDKLAAKYGGAGAGSASSPAIDDAEFERIRAGLGKKR